MKYPLMRHCLCIAVSSALAHGGIDGKDLDSIVGRWSTEKAKDVPAKMQLPHYTFEVAKNGDFWLVAENHQEKTVYRGVVVSNGEDFVARIAIGPNVEMGKREFKITYKESTLFLTFSDETKIKMVKTRDQ